MTHLTQEQAEWIAHDYQFIIGTTTSPLLPYKVLCVESYKEPNGEYSVIFKSEFVGYSNATGYLLYYILDHNLDFDYEKYGLLPHKKS